VLCSILVQEIRDVLLVLGRTSRQTEAYGWGLKVATCLRLEPHYPSDTGPDHSGP
jgi:hypothetical protein